MPLCCYCCSYEGHTIILLSSWLLWSCHCIVVIVTVVGVALLCYCCHSHSGHTIVSSLLSQLHRLRSDFGHYCCWTMVGEGKGKAACMELDSWFKSSIFSNGY